VSGVVLDCESASDLAEPFGGAAGSLGERERVRSRGGVVLEAAGSGWRLLTLGRLSVPLRSNLWHNGSYIGIGLASLMHNRR